MLAGESAGARSSGWRSWGSRLAFESVIIVLSIVGALAVDSWRDSQKRAEEAREEARKRAERVAVALAEIRREIASNRQEVEQARQYNIGVIERFRKAAGTAGGRATSDMHPTGVTGNEEIVSSAWDAAQASGIISDMPFQIVDALAKTYRAQRLYEEKHEAVVNLIVGEIMRGHDVFADPGMLAGILNEIKQREGGLLEYYDRALKVLPP